MALKGHVEIELKDVNTGEVERIEGDNMVTNAFNKFVSLLSAGRTAGNSTDSGMKIDKPAVSLLGGLVLYSENLTEDADNYIIKGTDHILGKAGQYSSQSANKGTYNALESGATETGYKHVWDFATSQCNGIINALSLVHPYFTDDSDHSSTILYRGDANQGYKLWYDDVNQDYYCYTCTSYNVTGIYKLHMPSIPMGVGNSFFERKENIGDSTKIAGPFELGVQIYDGNETWDPVTNKSYILTYGGWRFVVFDCATKTASIKDISLPVGKDGRYYQNAGFYGGNYYYWSSNGEHLVRVNLDDNTDYHIFDDLRGAYNDNYFGIASDGLLMYNGYNTWYKVYLDDTYERIGSGTSVRLINNFLRCSPLQKQRHKQ